MAERFDSESELPEGTRVVTLDEVIENFEHLLNGEEPSIPDGPIAIHVTSLEDEFKLNFLRAAYPGVLN